MRSFYYMLFVSCFLLVQPGFMGCATKEMNGKSLRTALDMQHTLAKGASSVAEPYFKSVCGEEAKKCAVVNDFKCEALVKCQADREVVSKGIAAIHGIVASGYAALMVGDEEGAKAKLSQILKAAAVLGETLNKAGVY